MRNDKDRVVSISIKPHDTESLKLIELLKNRANVGLNTFSGLVLNALKEKYSDDSD